MATVGGKGLSVCTQYSVQTLNPLPPTAQVTLFNVMTTGLGYYVPSCRRWIF